MDLIVYPETDYNSYIDLTGSANLTTAYVVGYAWKNLTPEQKTAYLHTAYRLIQRLEGFVAPDSTIPEDMANLYEAQFQIALHDVLNGISIGEVENQDVKKEKGGPVEIEYYESSGVTLPSLVPPEAVPCLKSFGWVGPSCTGLGSFRKIR